MEKFARHFANMIVYMLSRLAATLHARILNGQNQEIKQEEGVGMDDRIYQNGIGTPPPLEIKQEPGQGSKRCSPSPNHNSPAKKIHMDPGIARSPDPPPDGKSCHENFTCTKWVPKSHSEGG